MPTIQLIEPFIVPYVEPNDHGATRYVCLLKVTDSDGLTGWGEAATLFREATVATHALLRAYQDFALGRTSDAQTFSSELAAHGWWFGDTGIASFAAAALDMALWDIAAQRQSVPLAARLGSVQTRLPIVLSCHATLSDITAMTDEMAERVSAVAASGIKVGFGKRGHANLGVDHDRDVQFVRELRARVGDETQIMIDIGAKINWTVDEAVRRIHSFEEYGVYWTEEPLGADNLEGYRTLKDSVSSLIAYGEREWSVNGYAKIIASGTVDIVGIDPGRAQGVSGALATSRLIEAEGVQGNAHAFSGPLIFAASLALSQNSLSYRQIELMPLRNSLYDLVAEAPEPTNGTLSASDTPGIGVHILEERVRAAAVN